MTFSESDIQLLLKRKEIELKCLGINPKLFYQISKSLNREFKFIFKNDTAYVFKGHDSYDEDEIAEEVMRQYSLPPIDAANIVKEWTRDRIIYHNMIDNQATYYNWLTLPLR